jgi:hypothetical protein
MHKCGGDSEGSDRQTPPYRQPVRIWAGNGTGATCSLCGFPIQANEIEYEIVLPSIQRILRFHFHCHLRWQAQGRQVDQP